MRSARRSKAITASTRGMECDVKLQIAHTTTYSYDAPVSYALQQVRLRPQDGPQQKVLHWSVDISGGQRELSFNDEHGNHTTLVNVNHGETEVEITARGEVETSASSGVLGKVYGRVPLWHYCKQTARTLPGQGIRALARVLEHNDDQLANLHALSAKILQTVPYRTGVTLAETTAEEALAAKGGVCQDHAQIFIAAARQAGIPARYVSGYLMMDDRIDQEASHGWAEAHVHELGWVGFDVSNVISPDERYVRLATGLDSLDASPISGLRMGQAHESMVVSLQIQQ